MLDMLTSSPRIPTCDDDGHFLCEKCDRRFDKLEVAEDAGRWICQDCWRDMQEEEDENDFENLMCPACGQEDCDFAGHANMGWVWANSWGGSEFVTLGVQSFRKDLPVKVVVPAPRFKQDLFWVLK